MSNAETRKPNRLIDETSPYLRQHAYNPVDWHPWGDEALETARREDKPIFLSIGYSACHWCHVMEHESFESDEIAQLMNRNFVSIKVDREERPDLDQIYMNAVTALTGHGGWPMSVFLTPERKPFFGGTYWPPESRMGMPGFRDILEKVHEAWQQRREAVARGAEELTEAVVKMGAPQGEPSQLNEGLLENAQLALLRAADRTNGGFGGAPKFPHPMDLRLLLRLGRRFGSDDAARVVQLTLDKMAQGGIYDHLGGGFHRYSTDARWLVPHFEKMLYDNALLTSAYLEAHQATGSEEYGRVARETLDYVLREMTQPEGGFYSTQDADSEGVEGKYFVWSEAEINEHLEPDEARFFTDCYDVSAGGNWEGANILNRVKPHAEAARTLGVAEDELRGVLVRARRKLFEARQQRIAPGRDDKVLVSWNGLMIAAMAQAGQFLGEPKYVEAARNAADFILVRLRGDDGRLLHSFKDGRARLNAYLDDYAALIDGLVELYQATFEIQYVTAALELAKDMMARFQDESAGGFFYTAVDHESLIARNKDSQDTATPSGNSMAATALLRLGRLCGRTELEQHATATLEALSGQLSRFPLAGGQSLIALDFLLGPTREIAIVDGDRTEESERVLSMLHERFVPNKVVLRRGHDVSEDELPAALEAVLKGKSASDGAVTVYICRRGSCEAPLVGVEAFESAVADLG